MECAHQLFRGVGLGQKGLHVQVADLGEPGLRTQAADGDHLGLWIKVSQRSNQRGPIHNRHHQIRDDNADFLSTLAIERYGLRSIRRGHDPVVE